MKALYGKTDGHPCLWGAILGRGRRRGGRTRVVPRLEPLEGIDLLSVGCPTISGHVFLDVNSNPALTNNGIFDPGEAGLAGASVELLDSTGKVVATTTTGGTNGFYQFTGPQNTNVQPQQIVQTLTVPVTLTNFSNKAFTPALQLFDPSKGQLLDVKVTSAVNFGSTIRATNNASEAQDITATVTGTYAINGLGPANSMSDPAHPPTGSQTQTGVAPGQTVTFTPVTNTDQRSFTFLGSDPNAQFFAGPSGVTSMITPTFSATGFASAFAPGGNLSTQVMTAAQASVTVTYDYLPVQCFQPGNYTIVQTPIFLGNPPTLVNGKESQPGPNGTPVVFPAPPTGTPQSLNVTILPTTSDLPNNDFAKLPPTNYCATVTNVQRLGVHHQPTRIVLTLNVTMPLTPAQIAQLNNPSNYTLTLPAPNGQFNSPNTIKVPVASATYNPINQTATLVAAQEINLHQPLLLAVSTNTCIGPNPFVTVTGGKRALANFPHPFTGGHTAAAHPLRHR